MLSIQTNDQIIRNALWLKLEKNYRRFKHVRILNEFGVANGAARVDIAVINGIMHGFEIKSDKDTLERLPEQIREFSEVFDQMTLVVGKRHILDAIKMIPEWWGVALAKADKNGNIGFYTIREATTNREQNFKSIARLLWRAEALEILKNKNRDEGVRSKTCSIIYQRLEQTLNLKELKKYVRDILIQTRTGWRSDERLA